MEETRIKEEELSFSNEKKIDIKSLEKLLLIKDTALDLTNPATKKLLGKVISEIEEGKDTDNIIYHYLTQNLDDSVKPNTIGKILRGCVLGRSCPFSSKEPSFYYDINTKKMTRNDYGFENNEELNEGTIANLYLEDDMSVLEKSFFKEFEKLGFTKIKVHYRNPNQLDYSTYIIENLTQYLNEEKDGMLIVIFIAFLITCLFFVSRKF